MAAITPVPPFASPLPSSLDCAGQPFTHVGGGSAASLAVIPLTQHHSLHVWGGRWHLSSTRVKKAPRTSAAPGNVDSRTYNLALALPDTCLRDVCGVDEDCRALQAAHCACAAGASV